MKTLFQFSLFTLLLSTISAHFTLEVPASIGSNDATERTAPCGGFDINNRTNVTSYPIGGLPYKLLTTHAQALYFISTALANDTTNWISLSTPVLELGIGIFCLDAIPGPSKWAGQDAVVRIIQRAGDGGALYQCAAVKYTTETLSAALPACTNSTGITALYTSVTAAATATVSARPTSAAGVSTRPGDTIGVGWSGCGGVIAAGVLIAALGVMAF